VKEAKLQIASAGDATVIRAKGMFVPESSEAGPFKKPVATPAGFFV